ncbi:MAG: PA0069 family radical SAM protein [Nitrospirae bacterium]|nr:MAG: PA0069 family radical SAM protein [Nitrospirota bacterium]
MSKTNPLKVVTNPPNPYLSEQRELLEPPPLVKPEIYEERVASILTRNDSPDLPFRWSLNPYRGCFHACAYCYARPTHEYWGFGAGTDFESKLIVKINAPSRLRATFMKLSWTGELIVFSGNTDCYQPLEASYHLTRDCLAVCAEFRNPVGIITKAALIERDLDLLKELHHRAWLQVYFSIPFADDDTARLVEPHAPSITRRLHTMAILSQAGISTGVSIAPIIPGLNDHDIPRVLRLAREAGAQNATYALLRLNGSVEQVFSHRMAQLFPQRMPKLTNRLREMREGRLSEHRFFKRLGGRGQAWKIIEQMFELHSRKLGYDRCAKHPIPQTFRRPIAQPSLFDQ